MVGPGGEPAGGGYLSLTGPGQTATPGDLTQEGGFVVNVSDSTGFNVNATTAAALVQISSEAGFLIADTSAFSSSIQQFGSGSLYITGWTQLNMEATTSISLRSPLIQLFQNSSDQLRVWPSTPFGAPQQTVNGSRGVMPRWRHC